jgi:hypothetical protein
LIRLHHQAPKLCRSDRSLVASLTPFYARWHAGNSSSAKIPAYWEGKNAIDACLVDITLRNKSIRCRSIPNYSAIFARDSKVTPGSRRSNN